ncbi:MAG TPA: tetratricopeptide repeat protein [Longimicrobiaceae bacterium]|nr:tetratricopeptide repeat protein [Longimicrobiaceae bacterium]
MRFRFAVAALLLGASHAAAQQLPPPRPPLPRDADTRDWEAYFDYGVKVFTRAPGDARAAFYWATRLAPERAEPLMGSWAAYWYQWDQRFEEYLGGTVRPSEAAEVARVDSLRYRARARNPFVSEDLILLAIDHLPGRWSSDPVTRAMLASARGEHPRALVLLNGVVQRDPRRSELHRYRALVFTAMGRLDSAAVATEALLAGRRREDDRRMVRVYESKAMEEYGLGMLYLALHRDAAAREALGRAITEDLSFAPAHAMMGIAASAARDTATAFAEFRQAVELAPGDGVLRLQFGEALMNGQRTAEAVEQMRRAVRLEPDYAGAYLGLARTLDVSGDTPGAAEAYRAYLERAPLRLAESRAQVARRLAQIAPPPE